MNVLLYSEIPVLLKKPKIFFSIKSRSLSFSTLTGENPPFYIPSLSVKLASSLENCSDTNSLKKLHACILTRGLEHDSSLGSKLLNSYAKFDLLAESKWIFHRISDRDFSIWDPTFVGYFRAFHYDEVLGLYVELKRRSIGIYGAAVTFTVKSCGVLGDLKFGRAVHLDAVKLGLNTDENVGSSLVKMYSERAAIGDAAKVFDEITDRDVVVYTVMISGYAHGGDRYAYEAFRVAHEMQRENIEPNRVTLVSLLQAASSMGALQEGNALHGYALRRGIDCSNDVFVTTLMDMYIKCGVPDKATAVFVNTRTRSIGSWNALIGGYLRLGQSLEALELFVQMMTENHKPDLIAIANGLSSCGDRQYLRGGKSLHAYILRAGYKLDLVATTTLIDMYSKCNCVIQAEAVFDRTEHKDVVLFNVMIAGYLQNRLPNQAVKLFYEMLWMGFQPNISTIISVLSAVSDLKDAIQGNGIHGFLLKRGLQSNTELANQLVEMYARCRLIKSARQVFDRIEYKDVVSWTSAIIGHVNNGEAEEAVLLFHLMQREKINPDSITLVGLLQSIAQLGCLSFVRETHGRVHQLLSVQKDTHLVNSLIIAYSRCGDLSAARLLFECMPERDLASWNTMISAYGAHGDCVQAINLFNQMRKDEIEPDNYTFTSLLSACSHSGSLAEGLSIFRLMIEEHTVVPTDEHFGCMVDLLSRGGRLEEAYHLLNHAPLRENASALGAFLASCMVHRNAKMGETAGRQLLDLEPGNPSAYGLVSNLYAGQEKWEDVAQMETMAKEKGLKRVSGRSIIENTV
nr:pentatricopeptide repeat-containing protein At4g21300-like [Ipomoea batatas]